MGFFKSVVTWTGIGLASLYNLLAKRWVIVTTLVFLVLVWQILLLLSKQKIKVKS